MSDFLCQLLVGTLSSIIAAAQPLPALLAYGCGVPRTGAVVVHYMNLK